MHCEIICAIQDTEQMRVHRKCEWVTSRDDPEWINDEYRDHLGTVDREGDKVGLMNPNNYSLRDLIADLNNNSVHRRNPNSTPKFGIFNGE